MTMLSFRVADDEVASADRWARELGIDRSELLREALRRYVAALESERDAERWLAAPLDDDERALGDVADWGPAESWADWQLTPDDSDGAGADEDGADGAAR